MFGGSYGYSQYGVLIVRVLKVSNQWWLIK